MIFCSHADCIHNNKIARVEKVATLDNGLRVSTGVFDCKRWWRVVVAVARSEGFFFFFGFDLDLLAGPTVGFVV